ncbi:UDP-N-acetylmuramoyl-L-alanine--D-glutamate ligase [Microbulbifer sp. 2205BS26-8]|uniref:UDP-N-acetylmuramoyl-L-alanine--D-glutamate ligase n=1 Tax=Microbulbifer sp. 2205BS26-8 TaxID=3064386 RepID=UPI00274012A1|nr:UDP-N-acetylmuramoyl-L-alanine--D-glutamate ligase [Microbulbifer sp. 2205BS26-8]MDP5208982.1 UDP-N-acetylmuramoyl-L-alanine--D-glutamate ligase [Microbulbifer sp. 2205BS26-8]
MSLIATSQRALVIGLGATGKSVVRYLLRMGYAPVVADSRDHPPGLEAFRREFPQVPVETGPLNPDTVLAASEIIASPGIALAEPVLQRAIGEGIPVIGDIELFARALSREKTSVKLAAVTGSNGKSTVTTLLGRMAEASGKTVRVGGNIGVPVLDLLQGPIPQLFVLELSSFQLETTYSLAPTVATVLNLSADHMDRYPSMVEYHRAKQRVYRHAQQFVINRADSLTRAPLSQGRCEWSFGLDQPDLNQFGVRTVGGQNWLAQGAKTLLPVDALAMVGRHNVANALAALAMGNAIGLAMEAMLSVLRTFRGLPHRCERTADLEGVVYVNDSKGTNVGATQAALDGLATATSKIVLIAGGDGKGADFSALSNSASALRAMVSLGTDGDKVAQVFAGKCAIRRAASMTEAVVLARSLAHRGDYVLLSPACASFDMYRNFEARGEDFRQVVASLCESAGGAE